MFDSSKPLLLAAAFALCASTQAADLDTDAVANDPLASARADIAAHHYDQAIGELRRVNATGSADWNNLMGYALRKQSAPDLAGSEKYYDAALRIDPRHRGTLEYSGELYLMKGDLQMAQKRLVALQAICADACEESHKLKAAIAKYQANGNRYVGEW
jgi:tetratricopeptide (TPR) repeat protein